VTIAFHREYSWALGSKARKSARADPLLNLFWNLQGAEMETVKTRWRLLALVPLVALAILSIGNRTGAVPDQSREVREAANEVGILIQGGISQGQVLRFNVARLASGHPGGVNLELRVFDSNGAILAANTYVFPNGNQNGGVYIQSAFFDLSAAQLPASAFDNTGRAQLTGIVKSIDPNNPNRPPDPTCGFVASGEIFNIGDVNRQTLVHIPGASISDCRNH
jgi:hypothetical protein